MIFILCVQPLQLLGNHEMGFFNVFSSQYQLALHQIDQLRKDGKFIGIDGTIPEGQGIVMAHLNECHELLEMVRCISLHVHLFYLTIFS